MDGQYALYALLLGSTSLKRQRQRLPILQTDSVSLATDAGSAPVRCINSLLNLRETQLSGKRGDAEKRGGGGLGEGTEPISEGDWPDV